MTTRNYWIGVVSKAHVEAWPLPAASRSSIMAGPVMLERACARATASRSTRRAPTHQDGDRVQAFTAIGRIANGAISSGRAGGRHRAVPARGRVLLLRTMRRSSRCSTTLTFIRNKHHWGATFRFGCRPRAGGGFQRALRRRWAATSRSRLSAVTTVWRGSRRTRWLSPRERAC